MVEAEGLEAKDANGENLFHALRLIMQLGVTRPVQI